MDKKNMLFKDLHNVMDVRFRELREEGVGAVVKHAPVILPKEEDMLWKQGIPFSFMWGKRFVSGVVRSNGT